MGRLGQALQQRFIQQGFDRIPILILDENRVPIRVARLEQFTPRSAHAHREKMDPSRGQAPGRGLSQIFVVFTVGDQDHRLASARISAEGLNRLVEGGCQRRALFWNAIGVEGGHVLTEGFAV